MNPQATKDQSDGLRSSADWLPFGWCNLWRNPFGELTRTERADLAVVDLQPFVTHATQDHTAVQMIGGCGRGKTTRMLAIHRKFTDSSYVYLPEDAPCPPIAEGNPVLIDEAQRLPRRVRRAIFATGIPLILATHRDLTWPLRRAGYQVITMRIGSNNDTSLVHTAMNRRIQASALNPCDAVPELTVEDAQQLSRKFGSNIRAMESYLYDVVQTQVNGNGQMRFID